MDPKDIENPIAEADFRAQLCKDAAEDAIKKHRQIVADLQDIVDLNRNNYEVLTKEGRKITDLNTVEFALDNIERKVRSIEAKEADIQTCYQQMGVFKKK